jgi:hypothetical protein
MRRVEMLFSVLAGLTLMSACGDESAFDLNSRQAAVTCLGQYDKLVTTTDTAYLGARESQVGSDPNLVGHAADAELLFSQYASPSSEQFAIAWVRSSDKLVYVRAYSTATKAFTGPPQALHPWPSQNSGWVRTLGFDDNCLAIPNPQNTCAWFTWEDPWAYVNYRAVAPNGTLSQVRDFLGHHPSGDAGQVYIPYQGYIRRKLLAYISSNRQQVKARLLNNDGSATGTEVTLQTLSGNTRAYQTTVSWSSTDQRWVVAWTEHPYPASGNGAVKTRAVTFDGALCGNCTLNHIMYCEGDPNQPACAPSLAGASGGGILLNPTCSCYGIWQASSYYSNGTDRLRLHHYGKHVRLDNYGVKTALSTSVGCVAFCPITEAAFWYGSDYTPFQLMTSNAGTQTTDHWRLVRDSFSTYNGGQVTANPFNTPQAFRSDGSVAVGLATDNAGGLRLSIVDVKANGCPP